MKKSSLLATLFIKRHNVQTLLLRLPYSLDGVVLKKSDACLLVCPRSERRGCFLLFPITPSDS